MAALRAGGELLLAPAVAALAEPHAALRLDAMRLLIASMASSSRAAMPATFIDALQSTRLAALVDAALASRPDSYDVAQDDAESFVEENELLAQLRTRVAITLAAGPCAAAPPVEPSASSSLSLPLSSSTSLLSVAPSGAMIAQPAPTMIVRPQAGAMMALGAPY